VVNISPPSPRSRTQRALGPAALTKGGLAAATRSLAVEYASRGVRVNAVSPGIIQTPVHPPDSYDGLGDRLPPLGRVGQVSDVVDGILFLESSPYITGESCTLTAARSRAARPTGLPVRAAPAPPCANAIRPCAYAPSRPWPAGHAGALGERLGTHGGQHLVGGP